MKLGILVSTDRHLTDLIGLVKAALSKKYEVDIFFMDNGIRLCSSPAIARLCGQKGITLSYCNYNAQKLFIDNDQLPDNISCGSQYNNALMAHEADRVIVL